MRKLFAVLIAAAAFIVSLAPIFAYSYYSGYGYQYTTGPTYYRYYDSYGPSGWGYYPVRSYATYYPSYPSVYTVPCCAGYSEPYYYRSIYQPWYYNYWPYTYRVYSRPFP